MALRCSCNQNIYIRIPQAAGLPPQAFSPATGLSGTTPDAGPRSFFQLLLTAGPLLRAVPDAIPMCRV